MSPALIDKFRILRSLEVDKQDDKRVLKEKLGLLKEIALLLVEEIESFSALRSVNLTRGISLPDEMRAFEVHLIQSALERTGGHQTRAAQLLGIRLTTLHNKLKRLKITPDRVVNAPVIHEDRPFEQQMGSEIAAGRLEIGAELPLQ